MIEYDHRVWRQLERRHVALAVIAVVRVALGMAAVAAVEAHAVVLGRLQVREIWVGVPVAVTQIDKNPCALGGGLDGPPGRIGRVDLHDVGGELGELGRVAVRICPIRSGRAFHSPNDDDYLELRGGSGGALNGRLQSNGGGEQSDGEREGDLAHAMFSNP